MNGRSGAPMRIVIIQTAFIGDVILCTPLIELLAHRGHKVGFVVKPEAANILEGDPRITYLHIYDKRGSDSGIAGMVSTGRKLRSIQYDAALIPHRSVRSAFIACLARIGRRIGFSTGSGKVFLSDTVYYDKNAHEIIRNLSLAQPLNIEDEPPAPSLHISREDREAARRQFQEWNIGGSDVVIGLGPGSQWFTKQWGMERFMRLAELLARDHRFKVVSFGGPAEIAPGERIGRIDAGRIFNAAGVFSLKQSAAAIERVRVVVTNDNGLMHLSAAAGTPVIALFGPTVPGFGFAPWGDRHTVLERSLYCRPCSIHGTASCPEGHFRCMAEITPEEVVKTVLSYV